MKRREGVFDQFGALLQFPLYFGENWNAFADCVGDLGWLRTGGMLIVIFDAMEVLTEGDADELGLLLKILADTGQAWALANEFRGSKPFHVLLHAVPEQALGLGLRLAAHHWDVPLIDLT